MCPSVVVYVTFSVSVTNVQAQLVRVHDCNLTCRTHQFAFTSSYAVCTFALVLLRHFPVRHFSVLQIQLSRQLRGRVALTNQFADSTIRCQDDKIATASTSVFTWMVCQRNVQRPATTPGRHSQECVPLLLTPLQTRKSPFLSLHVLQQTTNTPNAAFISLASAVSISILIHSFIHIRLIISLTYRKPYSNNKARFKIQWSLHCLPDCFHGLLDHLMFFF